MDDCLAWCRDRGDCSFRELPNKCSFEICSPQLRANSNVRVGCIECHCPTASPIFSSKNLPTCLAVGKSTVAISISLINYDTSNIKRILFTLCFRFDEQAFCPFFLTQLKSANRVILSTLKLNHPLQKYLVKFTNVTISLANAILNCRIIYHSNAVS